MSDRLSEILVKLWLGVSQTEDINNLYVTQGQDKIDEAKASLLQALIETAPEKLESGKHFMSKPPYNPDAQGYNQAIDDYLANIREVFK